MLFRAEKDEFVYLNNVEVAGKLVYVGGGYQADGEIKLLKKFTCDRCLKETTSSSKLSFSEKFSPFEEDDATLFVGDKIDLTDVIRDNILAGESIGHLCKEDCKGLCKICGKDLNEGDCACDRFIPDPRFSVLENYMVNE